MPIPEMRDGAQQLDRDQVIEWLDGEDFRDPTEYHNHRLIADLMLGEYNPSSHDNYPEGHNRIADWFSAGAVAALGESAPTIEFARRERLRGLLKVAEVELEPGNPALRLLRLGAEALSDA